MTDYLRRGWENSDQSIAVLALFNCVESKNKKSEGRGSGMKVEDKERLTVSKVQ